MMHRKQLCTSHGCREGADMDSVPDVAARAAAASQAAAAAQQGFTSQVQPARCSVTAAPR